MHGKTAGIHRHHKDFSDEHLRLFAWASSFYPLWSHRKLNAKTKRLQIKLEALKRKRPMQQNPVNFLVSGCSAKKGKRKASFKGQQKVVKRTHKLWQGTSQNFKFAIRTATRSLKLQCQHALNEQIAAAQKEYDEHLAQLETIRAMPPTLRCSASMIVLNQASKSTGPT